MIHEAGARHVPTVAVFCDGGSRGNPGPAAIGAVVSDPGTRPPTRLASVSRYIGETTNNVAESRALIAGLEAAREIAGRDGVEVVAVVEPESEIAAAVSQSGRVGVLATPATVRSGAYLRALARQGRPLTITEVEAPDLAAVIQRGFPFDESVVEMVRAYCEPLERARVDTVILGCTHYPLVAPMLQRTLGRDVRLVTGGHGVAAKVQRILQERSLAAAPGTAEGDYSFACTGDPEAFRELGTRFLQLPLGEVERVTLT